MARPFEGVFLTPAEVAARLRVSRPTVYALIARGQIIARRVGLSIRIHPRALDEYLDGHRAP